MRSLHVPRWIPGSVCLSHVCCAVAPQRSFGDFSSGTVFVSEDTVRRGWETVRDRYREKYSDRAKMGFLTFFDLEIRPLSPDSAVALGRWGIGGGKESAARAIYAHLQTAAGRVADCARSHISGSAAVIR